jgi:hypothetical protein
LTWSQRRIPELTERIKAQQPKWNWLEALMERIPVNYLLISYLLFIVFFAIYYLFSWQIRVFHWLIRKEDVSVYLTWYISQSLAQSILVPYLTAGLIYLSGKTKETFRYIDKLHDGPQNYYFNRIQTRVIGFRGYHLLLFLSVVVPFIIMSWGRWDYHQKAYGNWAWGLDIYSYLLSFLILALLTELLWFMANIVLSVNEIGCMADIFSKSVDVFSIGMKLRPLRNFFLIFIVYYFLAITLIIYTYLSPIGEVSFEPIYFAVLLALGAILFVAGLEAIQRIINCRVENELDNLNKKHAERDRRLMDVVFKDEDDKKASEIDSISKILDIIRKERESLLQIKRRAYDVASVGLFICSFLIPLFTMLEKLGLLHK